MRNAANPPWSLPYESPSPTDPSRRRLTKVLRIAAYVALIAVLVGTAVQFQCGTMKNLRAAQEFDDEHGPGAKADPSRPKEHKGAVSRWRKAIVLFWDGHNIYDDPAVAASAGENLADTAADEGDAESRVYLHPNTPFTVILLTPLTWLSVPTMAGVYNALKILAFLASALMIVSTCNHGRLRMPDWVLGLGLLWAILYIVGDIQHGNTNVLVLFMIAMHLWLFRRGRDAMAGAALAVAVCLKMTPAIFILYWLWQRNWRLLGGWAGAMAVCTLAIPLAAAIVIRGGDLSAGWGHFLALNGTWLENLIIPGLVKGAWYPIHVNQSLSGVFGRYFLNGPGGDIFWGPDDNPYSAQTTHGWICMYSMSEATVKMLVRLCQVVIVAAVGWAIGWRRLPREDGRRGLHYAMVLAAMLILNQRTWDHHAGVLLIADVAIWYTIAFGNVSRRARLAALVAMLAAGPLAWGGGNDPFKVAAIMAGRDAKVGGYWADIFNAYGPAFWHFMLLLVAGLVLTFSLKRASEPFANQRRTLRRQDATA